MTRPGRFSRTALVAAVALTAAGCGIRGTSVPVDAGGAPSRVSCKVPDRAKGTPTEGLTQVTVYLVCSSTLAQVERTVGLTAPTTAPVERLRAARALLDELRQQPSRAEEEAGFSSAVPQELKVNGPRAGDPAESLRLSIRPEDLPSFALAQLVCTYGAAPALGRTHAAVLGGPGKDVPHRYDCSSDVLSDPDIAQNAGWGDPLSEEG
ncbi:hypothetical protein AB0D04_08705 [Streptomyces sp. NPDC048483]|uniref:hypothetical protein n=1 Tax=Streptomyces sp. NPDC048483 TaxID=3154927 RepID=UPI003445530E